MRPWLPLFVTLFLDQHEHAPARIVLDVDATDDRIHGHQEGRAFHGYYGHNCYLPLYVFFCDGVDGSQRHRDVPR